MDLSPLANYAEDFKNGVHMCFFLALSTKVGSLLLTS